MEKHSILIADDVEINLTYLAERFSAAGFFTVSAGDGLEALEKLKVFIPDVILTDNVMPRMSGVELIKELQKNEKLKNVPVIMLTAVDGFEDKEQYASLGVADYIIKPLSFDGIFKRVLAVLDKKEGKNVSAAG